MKKTLFAALTILFFGACSKSDSSGSNTTPAPTVDFSYSGANVPAPATVSFTSSTTNATSYLWDFGDNGSSTSANPDHTYTAGGVYTVKLTATGAGGSTSTTKTVNIGAAPTTFKISKVKILTLPFTNSSGVGWDNFLGGGGPDLYFTINIGSQTGTIVHKSTPTINDVTTSQIPLTWNLTTPYSISNFSTQYSINIWDEDGVGADHIGGYYFKVSDNTSGYPTTITLQNSTTTLALQLTVQWL